MNKTPCGMIRRCRFALHGGIVFFLLSATATAAGYPDRPIRLLVPQAPGSASDTVADNPLRSLQAASCTYRIALGPRAGQKVLSLRTVAGRDEKTTAALCADVHGFSLHAGVRCGAGDVVLQLKSAWRDGTTHIKMSPLEFMQRLAALVPRPPAQARVRHRPRTLPAVWWRL